MSDSDDDHDAILSKVKIAVYLRTEIAGIYADVDAAIFRSSLAKKATMPCSVPCVT